MADRHRRGAVRPTRSEPIGVAFSGRHRQRLGVPRDLPHHAAPRPVAVAAQGVRAESSATDPTSSRRGPSCRRSACRCSSRRSRRRPEELDVGETVRVLEDYKALDVECAAMGLRLCRGIRAALSGMAASGRRRRRRRKPEGLSDRRESRAHDPQRRRQPDAVPGRLGRRPDQALADLQRRAEPQLRAHLRAGAPLRLRRIQSLHAAERDRGGGRDPVRGAHRATTCRRSTR